MTPQELAGTWIRKITHQEQVYLVTGYTNEHITINGHQMPMWQLRDHYQFSYDRHIWMDI